VCSGRSVRQIAPPCAAVLAVTMEVAGAGGDDAKRPIAGIGEAGVDSVTGRRTG
jgi:hypothetical protein